MNKKVISLVMLVGFFCLASFVLAQTATIAPLPGMPTNLPQLMGKIVMAVGTLIASLGTVMIIVAGILYLLSAGSPEKVGTAKEALIYAIAGLAIGLAADAIVAIITSVTSG